jgi:hypothetical protein
MFYKVVEGLVPAIASEDYLKGTKEREKPNNTKDLKHQI